MSEEIEEELGPIEWIVVEFPKGTKHFDGAMAAELSRLVEAEIIRILDLVIIDKDDAGEIAVIEYEDLGEASGLRAVEGKLAEVLALEDIDRVAEAVLAGSTAAILVWENTWAAPFGAATRRSGGQLLDSGKIPTQALIAAVQAGTEGD